MTRVGEQYHAELWDDKKWTPANVQFCINFVIESSLKLQDFDYDIQHIINNEPLTLEYVSGDFETGIVFREVPEEGNK